MRRNGAAFRKKGTLPFSQEENKPAIAIGGDGAPERERLFRLSER
jgi:hypothetical protein